MRLSTKSMAAIAGLSVATAGAIAIPFISSPSSADPLQQVDRSGWQIPINLSQRPMHWGGWGDGPMHRGGWGQSPMNQNGWQGHQHMMQMMQANNEFECLSLMIPHHEEAIATAQRVLEYSDRPEMREFARNIIDVQTAEIGQMENWLDEWYPGQETNLSYTPMMRDMIMHHSML
jgi:hypothetical protein